MLAAKSKSIGRAAGSMPLAEIALADLRNSGLCAALRPDARKGPSIIKSAINQIFMTGYTRY
jgi:hypothetical protein